MITKNIKVLYALYPLTFAPLAIAGTLYARADFSNALYILYAILPLGISLALTVAAAVFSGNPTVKTFVEKCSLARFSVLAFATYVASLIVASGAALIILGRSHMPFVLGAWMVMLTIFAVYLFCWLYIVYRILYKDNPDFA